MSHHTDYMKVVDKIIKAIKKSIKTELGIEILWRMTSGNRDKSRLIVKSLLPHYTNDTDVLNASDRNFDEAFDYALGELNGGVEIEWAS